MILPMDKPLRKEELLPSVLVSSTNKVLERILETIGMVRNLEFIQYDSYCMSHTISAQNRRSELLKLIILKLYENGNNSWKTAPRRILIVQKSPSFAPQRMCFGLKVV